MFVSVEYQVQSKIKEYIELIEKVAKVEQRRIPSHMVEYEELVSIGTIAIQTMIAVRWAIRNELRNRYKWYSLKNTKSSEETDGEMVSMEENNEDGEKISPHKVREAIYTTILSIDSLQQANSDSDSPFDFIKDTSALPDERAEISELGKVIREAIATLPQKDRTIVEYRFYRNMQVKEIAAQVGLSSSRITRIVQSALNYVREYLQKREHYGY